MRSPDNERGLGRRPQALDSTLTTPATDQSERQSHFTGRFAEDAANQLAEADRFFAAADHALLAAILDGDDLVAEVEGAVLLLGRGREFLKRVLVREVAA